MIPGTWLIGARSAFDTWWKAGLGFVLGALASAPLAYCEGKSAGTGKADAAAAIATVEVMQVDGNAKEVAAIERRKDDAAVTQLQEELIDAVASLPDSLPSPRRVALGCARLRDQGTDTSNLPACAGSGGGTQAPAKP